MKSLVSDLPFVSCSASLALSSLTEAVPVLPSRLASPLSFISDAMATSRNSRCCRLFECLGVEGEGAQVELRTTCMEARSLALADRRSIWTLVYLVT